MGSLNEIAAELGYSSADALVTSFEDAFKSKEEDF
jgi:AraC-like DNA-binding protein